MQKMLTKLLAGCLVLVLCLSLSGCGLLGSASGKKDYAGIYTGFGLYADGQYLLEDSLSSMVTTLNDDGTGYVDWGEENRGPITEWTMEDGKLLIVAGLSAIEGSITDGVMLLEMGKDYTLASAKADVDISLLNGISLNEYMSNKYDFLEEDTEEASNEETSDENTSREEASGENVSGENTEDTFSEESQGELEAPVMKWAELYNPNGFDTVTAVIENPNDVAIDVDYDLVFYKDGVEVSRIEYCGNYSILPGHEDLIWMNYDVPSSDEADEVRMENVYVTEAFYSPIDGDYEYVGIVDGEACYDFTFDSQPMLATIWFVLYNDTNGNGGYDQGEIVVVEMASLMEQTGRVSFDPNVYSYTDCAVFFNAY